METAASGSTDTTDVFRSETLVKGRPAIADYIRIAGQTYSIERGVLTVVRLEEEWFDDVRDPAAVVHALKNTTGFSPDIFTFWQRLPNIEPRYPFYFESESIAALSVTTAEDWWKTQISSRTRNLIRKAKKDGVEVRETVYDDDFVRGMTDIFNETSVRQGRRFWHYGKDFDTIKRQFSRFLFREVMIGAYYNNQLIGFIMLANAGQFALTGQIISKVQHRDKATNNALIAKAIEVCETRSWPYLVYLHWNDSSLTEFKRRCGFQEVKIPRYYVPLSRRGKLGLQLGLHRGLKHVISPKIVEFLKNIRRNWYDLQSR